MESQGFEVMAEALVPMRLLEPWQILHDEGWCGTIRFFFNLLRSPSARRRILSMRQVFRRHGKHLAAIMLVGRKREER